MLDEQAEACLQSGSPLYSTLLGHLAEDVSEGGPGWSVLRERAGDDPDSALGLRLMGAVHRLVLSGHAAELAAHYPSAGGALPPAGAWRAFRALLEERAERLREDVKRPCQTNEVGRCTALIGGFLVVARDTGLPLRILEIGASAGLNLRWDHFRYEARGATWGDASSPVRLCDYNTQALPPFDVEARVESRSGCDRNPLDVARPDDRLTLTSFLWADQISRLRLLKEACRVAARVPARLDRTDAPGWVEDRLARSRPGVASVVFHSIVLQYLDDDARTRFVGAIEQAGDRATREAPVAWLRMEPAGDHADVTLTAWPGGHERLLARSGFHGAAVQWLAD